MKIKVEGTNLGKISAELKRISEYNWTNNPRLKTIIAKLEKLYINLNYQANELKISPMNVDQNGYVIIKNNMINHKCSNNLEILKTISQYGLLASEWFGELESEREGCFCTFITRMKNDDYKYHGDLAEDNYSQLNVGENVILFFDEDNPIMKYLLHLDYFSFEYHKKVSSNYKSLYTDSELALLEELIEPLSPAGKNMHHKITSKTNYWSAIPGGIPSSLIVGICIKNNTYTDAEIDLINSYFPQAVIFNSKQNVVRYPLQSFNENKRKI